PRPEMRRYGGNTSCVEVCTGDLRHVVILDAGTGICALGNDLQPEVERIDVLLTHLHMDHILGLGFFAGLFRPDLEVHLWRPSSTLPGCGPAMADRRFPERPGSPSGYERAARGDGLVHDGQYRGDEHEAHFGWAHTSISHALGLASLVGARHLVPSRNDPGH